jgi:hypothetical protein
MIADSTSHKVVDRGAAARWVQDRQARGHKVVFTNGCFDLLHRGHVHYLEEDRRFGRPPEQGSRPAPQPGRRSGPGPGGVGLRGPGGAV